MQHQGEITHWQGEAGFGFITPNDSIKDIVVTAFSFHDQQRRPSRGDRVNFEVEADPNGRLYAKGVHYIEVPGACEMVANLKVAGISFLVIASISGFLWWVA